MVSDHLHSISQMVQTRATTAPTPTPARQGASEPTIGAVAREGAVARGRGRGCKRTPSRGRGQTPGPACNRAVTPPPTDEVVREGEEMIHQVLTYLSVLPDQGQTPPVFSAPTPQVLEVQHAAAKAPRMNALLEVGKFP